MARQSRRKGGIEPRTPGVPQGRPAPGSFPCGLLPECSIVCDRGKSGLPGISRRRVLRGETLFTAGTPATEVFGIRRGLVRLWRDGAPAGERTVALLGAGDALGLGVLDDPTWPYHATAVLATELCFVPLQAFLERADADLGFCRYVSGLLARRMRSLRAEAASDRSAGLDVRLGWLLRRLTAEGAPPPAVGPGAKTPMLAPSELARLLNESETAVRNALERLKK